VYLGALGRSREGRAEIVGPKSAGEGGVRGGRREVGFEKVSKGDWKRGSPRKKEPLKGQKGVFLGVWRILEFADESKEPGGKGCEPPKGHGGEKKRVEQTKGRLHQRRSQGRT